jgi:hypothetical protein
MATARTPLILWIILLTITIFSFSLPAQAKYSGGTGEPNDPYQIATAEDLMLLGDSSEDYDKHFILTADIDLDPNLPGRKVFDKAIIAPDTGEVHQSFGGPSFSGHFDGQEHAISNLNIQGENYLGLFGYVSPEANISNLGLEAVDVSGSYSVGGLAGINSGNILSSYSMGAVSGLYYIGGLVGENTYGYISLSYSTGVVTGSSYIGGLAGENTYGCILSCYSSSKVSSEWDDVGGLVGTNYGNISSSYSTGRVDGVYDVGGLVGKNSGNIAVSYSTGSLRGGNDVGGLVGYNGGGINASYSTVTILANDNVGGLAGSNSGSISSSYSAGTIVGVSDVGGLVGNTESTGGMRSGNHSSSSGVVMNSFWDIQTSGQDASAGGTGLSTTEMQNINTFLNEGWDFIDETANGTCDFWQFQEGAYPSLAVFSGIIPIKPQGAGTPEEPYLITNIDELLSIWYRPMAHYRLTKDIDLSGITRNLSIVPWLGGSFDGNDFCIRSLHIQGKSLLGMFGILGPNSKVTNLVLEDVSIEGTGHQIGGLAGFNLGSILSSYSTGTVNGIEYIGGLVGMNYGSTIASYSAIRATGIEFVGGLVGYNEGYISTCYSISEVSGIYDIGGLVGRNCQFLTNTGTITYCYSTGTVTGNDYVGGLVGSNAYSNITSSYSTSSVSGDEEVGGLVGDNWGSITTSYSNGSVSGKEEVGGLVGYNNGDINMSYSTGIVSGEKSIGGLAGLNWHSHSGNIISSFWNVETSGSTNMCGRQMGGETYCDDSYGKTTDKMQTAGTFLEAGWDFMDEITNGTEDIWWIDEGVDYPHLWWELIPEN